MKNYYQILGLQESASSSDIRQAFRTLAFTFHPDVAGDTPEAADQFILVREAYDTLRDVDLRRKHDADLTSERDRQAAAMRAARRPRKPHRPPPAAPPPPAGPRAANFTATRAPHVHDAAFAAGFQPRAHDLSGSLEVSLEDSLKSLVYTFELADGTAAEAPRRKVHVRLPSGLYPGARLRVKGLGHVRGNQRGDLVFDINFAPHPYLRVCGETLFCDVTLQPWQCALGGQVQVATLEGMRVITLPPIINTPAVRRLEGAGLYRADGSRGELWLNIKLEVPPPTTFRARRLWAELAEEYRHAQRPH